MRENFDTALAAVLRHEGGFSDHPKDPGGATNKGITLATLAAWRRRTDGPPASLEALKAISEEEVAAIYRAQYWQIVKGDHLPSGVDYAVFDFAVNSGPRRAVQFLQRIVGANPDGVMGVNTLAAVERFKAPRTIIDALCDKRLAWLKTLSTWSTFGKGWTRRVQDVRDNAIKIAAGQSAVLSWYADPHPAPSTEGDKVKATSTPEGKGLAVGGASGVAAVLSEAASKIEVLTGISDVLLWIFIALTVAGIGFTVWKGLQRARRQEA